MPTLPRVDQVLSNTRSLSPIPDIEIREVCSVKCEP
jgi:hypothetical protein